MIISLITTVKFSLFLDIFPEDLLLGAAVNKGEFQCQCGECGPEEILIIEIGLAFFKICLTIR